MLGPYRKCRGALLRASRNHSAVLPLLIANRLRTLGIPMSSHFFWLCALSTSLLEGDTNRCMQKLEAPRSRELRMLTSRCRAVVVLAAFGQSPVKAVAMPSFGFHDVAAIIASIMFRSRTVKTIKIATSTPPRQPENRDRFVLLLWMERLPGSYAVSSLP